MKSFLINAIVLLFILVSSIFADGYSYEGGPASWNVNSYCGGNKQSPIDFNSIKDKSGVLPDFYIANANNFTVDFKGHNIEVRVSDSSLRSYITFNSVTYYFDHLHFHTPSEHHIDGKHFDAEAHFVFKDQNKNLAVLGVLYRVSAGGFSKLLNSIPYVMVFFFM
jgi:carbonic anhydrase